MTPAALVYMFPDLFKIEGAPSSVPMVAATVFALDHDGVARMHPSKRGRFFKKDTVVLVKQRNFRQRDYGVLSRKLYRARVGDSVTVYDLVVEKSVKGKLDNPNEFVERLVISQDFNRATWNFLFREEVVEAKRSLLDRLLRIPNRFVVITPTENVELYKPQALALKRVFDSYVASRPHEFKVIVEECKRALYDMEACEGY